MFLSIVMFKIATGDARSLHNGVLRHSAENGQVNVCVCRDIVDRVTIHARLPKRSSPTLSGAVPYNS